jgi:hypothetical protein
MALDGVLHCRFDSKARFLQSKTSGRLVRFLTNKICRISRLYFCRHSRQITRVINSRSDLPKQFSGKIQTFGPHWRRLLTNYMRFGQKVTLSNWLWGTTPINCIYRLILSLTILYTPGSACIFLFLEICTPPQNYNFFKPLFSDF